MTTIIISLVCVGILATVVTLSSQDTQAQAQVVPIPVKVRERL